ncbi:unnamed protein product [Mytilus edulis]|uniref:Uncharacterized protein n=1 Tax=Mytilus edulis TaxID=6550 RepID=A0A8S3UPY9_MYTED|nr:unnamed protein product [Mytilus edulis]
MCVHVLKYNPTRLKARLVNEFGDNLTFWRSGRQNSLLVFCSSVPTGQIVQTAIESSTLVQSNNTLNAAVGKEDIVTTVFYAAKAIRNVISLDSKSNIPWPPTGESISENNIVIPDLLYNFLALLLTDDSTHASISPSKLDISSEVLHRRIMSLAQDLIYSVSKGYTKTPKHVALAIYLKTQTGSSEIVKIINRFGHSVSYDQVEEIETAIAEKMIMNTEDDIFIPSIIRKGVFSSFCWDNNDLCEETLSGQGTTHCTNGIVIQTRPDWCENEDEANQTSLQRSYLRKSTGNHLAFIAVIGKRFGDAGLGDFLLESGVIGAGSLTGVFEGKRYNRALRLHKIVFEAFERLRWEAFGSWLNSNDENEFLDPNFQASVLSILAQIRRNLTADNLKTLLMSPYVGKLFEVFSVYCNVSEEPMKKLWKFLHKNGRTFIGIYKSNKEDLTTITGYQAATKNDRRLNVKKKIEQFYYKAKPLHPSAILGLNVNHYAPI